MPRVPATIERLTDKQLMNRLREYNTTVGPIVPSTRRVYERRLFYLETGIVAVPSNNYEPVDDDDDDNIQQTKQYVEPEPIRQPVPSCSSPRQRMIFTERKEIEKPLRRRPLHHGIGDSTHFPASAQKRIPQTAAPSQKAHGPSSRRGSIVSVWVILLVFIVIAAVGFAVYKNIESEPVSSIPEKIEMV